jgi:recombination DNA repair RAD52 pathway protein
MASEHAMNGTKRFGAEHFTPEESTYLQHVLAKQLGPEWVSQRPGPAGGMHMLWGLIFRWENEADNC